MVKIFQKSCQQRIQEDSKVKFHKIRLILTCYMFISCRLYSCLANGSADEFQRGEQLFRVRAVKDPLQIGKNIAAHISRYFRFSKLYLQWDSSGMTVSQNEIFCHLNSLPHAFFVMSWAEYYIYFSFSQLSCETEWKTINVWKISSLICHGVLEKAVWNAFVSIMLKLLIDKENLVF